MFFEGFAKTSSDSDHKKSSDSDSDSEDTKLNPYTAIYGVLALFMLVALIVFSMYT